MYEMRELARVFTAPRVPFVDAKDRAVALLKVNHNLMLDYHFVLAVGAESVYGPLQSFEMSNILKYSKQGSERKSDRVVLVKLSPDAASALKSCFAPMDRPELASWHRPKGWSGWFTACYVYLKNGQIAPTQIEPSEMLAALGRYLTAERSYGITAFSKEKVSHDE